VTYLAGTERLVIVSHGHRTEGLLVVPCGPLRKATGKPIEPPEVLNPHATNDPPPNATVGKKIAWEPKVTGIPGTRKASYALGVAPPGLTIDAKTGAIEWTPGPAQIGSPVAQSPTWAG